MPVDIEYLRQHYATLSDEGLEEINPADLVEAARAVYEAEVRSRNMAPGEIEVEFGEEVEYEHEVAEDWLEDAIMVYSRQEGAGSEPPPDVVDARNALEAEGIPCKLEFIELPVGDGESDTIHEWQVLVPGQLNMHASSVLDRDLFNKDFEDNWRNLLHAFSDEELRQMNPQFVFCGLFDRVERVTRAWKEEVARRG
jgi:hypothetical protein